MAVASDLVSEAKMITSAEWADYARCLWRAALIYRENGHTDIYGYPMWRKMVQAVEDCTMAEIQVTRSGPKSEASRDVDIMGI